MNSECLRLATRMGPCVWRSLRSTKVWTHNSRQIIPNLQNLGNFGQFLVGQEFGIIHIIIQNPLHPELSVLTLYSKLVSIYIFRN